MAKKFDHGYLVPECATCDQWGPLPFEEGGNGCLGKINQCQYFNKLGVAADGCEKESNEPETSVEQCTCDGKCGDQCKCQQEVQ